MMPLIKQHQGQKSSQGPFFPWAATLQQVLHLPNGVISGVFALLKFVAASAAKAA